MLVDEFIWQGLMCGIIWQIASGERLGSHITWWLVIVDG
jgi:hypothetical protein